MAGTPSGRGCDYCRRQKQKCDQLRPQCTRCKRLQIPCKGAGKQRYIFKTQVLKDGPTAQSPSPSRTPTAQVSRRVPDCEATQTAQSLVKRLQLADPRYDLWVYGVLLEEVPRRLGCNGALDASTDCFLASLLVLHTGNPTELMHRKYFGALSALRETLDDPLHATSSSTLCAIYLLTITQLYLGIGGGISASHSRGVLQIIRYATAKQARDEFDLVLLKTLSFQVAFESLFNTAIQLDDHFLQLTQSWEIRRLSVRSEGKTIEEPDDSSIAIPSLMVRNIARLSLAIRKPSLHLRELRQRYCQGRRDLYWTHKQVELAVGSLASLENSNLSGKTLGIKRLLMHQTVHGLLLTEIILLNRVLFNLGGCPTTLDDESVLHMIQDVLDLAASCSKYRPLGASFMPVCLMTACAATDDSTVEAKLMEVLRDWERDFPVSQYQAGVQWLRENVLSSKTECDAGFGHDEISTRSTTYI